ALLVPHVDHLRPPVALAAAFDVEQADRGDEVAELAVAVAARIEVRTLLGDDRSDAAEAGPTIVVGCRVDRVAQQVHESAVALERGARTWLEGLRLVGLAREDLGVDELVAGGDERFGRLL